MLDDLEKVRIANNNRLQILTRNEPDTDRINRGFGLDTRNSDIKRLQAICHTFEKAEHDATLNLQRVLRAHPLGPWVKKTVGIGEKQAARLLAAIGDPYWNTLHDRPRKVSELWAYCGYHVVDGHAPRRTRNVKDSWSNTARMRTRLIAESCIKQATSPYRQVYDQARTKYNEAVHTQECVRCGPSGKPAPAGTPLSAGHQHNRALRAVSKTILKDLWIESKTIHEALT